MSATARQEREMKMKFEKMKNDPSLSPLEKLRAVVLSKGVRSIKSLHRSFKKIDVNGDHKIDFDEFQNALRMLGSTSDESVVRACFDEMDRDKTGSLDSEEFIRALRPPMNNNRKSLVQQAFNKLDKTGDNVVTTEDLKGVYSASKHPKYMSGEMTEEQVFIEFLNSFNGPTNFSGVVTYEEFEDYYHGVSVSIDGDAYFDLMMRKAWKL